MARRNAHSVAALVGGDLHDRAGSRVAELCDPGAGAIALSYLNLPLICSRKTATVHIKDSYLRSAVGWVAGLQARLGVELDKPGAASLGDMLMFLQEQDFTVDDIQRKADAKWRVYSKLAGGGSGV